MPDRNINVTICMGSSCFSRGNNKTLKFIQEFVESNHLERKIDVAGSLCEDKCNCGPHIKVDGKRYDNITPETAIDVIMTVLSEK